MFFNDIDKLEVNKDTQFAVLGLGQFGRSLVKVLSDNNYHVLGCDIDRNVVNEVSKYATYVVEADVTSETALDNIGINNFDVVIIDLSDEFEVSIVTTLMIKERDIPFIIAKANDLRQKKILESVGADWVLLPDMEIGEKIAHFLITDNPMKHIDQSDLYDIVEIDPEKHWINKRVRELDLIKKESIIILAILRDNETFALFDPETKILSDDKLIVLKLT